MIAPASWRARRAASSCDRPPSPRRRASIGRDALALAVASAAGALLPRSILADAIPVGEASVTPLLDGTFALTPDLMPTLDAAAFAAALAAGGTSAEGGAFMAPVNVFLVRAGGRTALIDASGSPVFAPTMGALSGRLTDLGVAPAEIDAVMMTHLHPDHTDGLLGPDGAAFPNAEIVVAEGGLTHWTDPATRAALPEPMRPLVDALAAALAPYGDRVRTYAGGAEVMPGLVAVPLPGHTPGHAGYRLGDGGDALLIRGDVVHAAPIQMGPPGLRRLRLRSADCRRDAPPPARHGGRRRPARRRHAPAARRPPRERTGQAYALTADR